jgi:hypothetical protein
MHLSHRALKVLSGSIWFAVGLWLLPKGLRFLEEASRSHVGSPWIDLIAPYTGSIESALILMIAVALFIGYFKGTRVLGKSAHKGSDRIQTLSNPAPITQLYKPSYFLLLGVMMAIGMGMNYFAVPLDIRGFVDVAVGAALINGSMVYFRRAFQASL